MFFLFIYDAISFSSCRNCIKQADLVCKNCHFGREKRWKSSKVVKIVVLYTEYFRSPFVVRRTTFSRFFFRAAFLLLVFFLSFIFSFPLFIFNQSPYSWSFRWIVRIPISRDLAARVRLFPMACRVLIITSFSISFRGVPILKRIWWSWSAGFLM